MNIDIKSSAKECKRVHAKMWDTPAHRVVSNYMSVIKLHKSILDRRLKQTGVYRSQHQILMIIAENPNASQTDIARWLNVSTATIAVSLKKMEKGGYIDRVVDQEDNRFNQIAITEQGRVIVEHSCQFFKNVEEQMFCNFTKEELDCLQKFLEKAYCNLSELISETEREDR